MESPAEPRFSLGLIVATPGAQESIPHAEIITATLRHNRGDWGELGQEDVQENEYSLTHDLRLLSAYVSAAGIRFWVITEADRSATTVLLPEEY